MSEFFGSYTLLEQIGVGGMAEVFLARHTGVEGFEKEVVIKRIRPHLSATDAFVTMFLGEAKLAAQLAHPNIVQIHDLGLIDASYFIAMEYVAGRDMSSIVPRAKSKDIPFPVEYALKIASNVCEALFYAHTKTDAHGHPLHIVHRDVSPENIRVAWNGNVKILDFGIAKAATQMHETKAGEVKGKLMYMSPEQTMGKPVDARSDVFSLGVVLYEALTGLKLFSGENDLAIMNNIIDGKIYPPSYFRDDIQPEVEAIIMKALEKDRKKRYQTAFDMQYDIDTFLAGHDFTPSNVHLSNFLKQLYKEDIQAEQARRSRREPAMTPPKGSRAASSGRRKAAGSGKEKAMVVTHGGSADDAVPIPTNSITVETDGLFVSLTDDQMERLKRLAAKKGQSVDTVARDILAQVLGLVD